MAEAATGISDPVDQDPNQLMKWDGDGTGSAVRSARFGKGRR